MTFPSFTTYFVELVFCAFLIVAVRTVGGRWIGPGARRLLWVLLILKALVPLTVPTAYHPLGALAKLDVTTTQEPVVSATGGATLSPGVEAIGPVAIGSEDITFSMFPHGTVQPGAIQPDGDPARSVVTSPVAIQPAADAPGFSITTALLVVWGLGAVVLFGVAVWKNRRVARNTTQAPVAVPDWVQAIFLDCRKRLRLRVLSGLVVSPCVLSPCLIGAIRPQILIPESLIEHRTPESEGYIRHLLLHELAHLKQGDVWLAWLWTLALAVQWFNPLFWGLGRWFRFDCEAACDDRVLTSLQQHERGDYGDSLLQMLIDLHPATQPTTRPVAAPHRVPGTLGIAETRVTLERRLAMMNSHRMPSWTRRISACVVLGLLATLCLTSYAQQKQKSPTTAPAKDAAKADALPPKTTIAPTDAAAQAKTSREARIEQLNKIVSLTEEQKKKIGDLFDADDKAMEEYQPQLDQLQQAGKAAFASGDKDKMAEIQKDWDALLKIIDEQYKTKRDADFLNLLTSEQQAAWRVHQVLSVPAVPPMSVQDREREISTLFKGVTLTDKQKQSMIDLFDARDKQHDQRVTELAQAVKAAHAGSDKDAIAKTEREYRAALASLNRIRRREPVETSRPMLADLKAVLTDQQRAQLDRMQVIDWVRATFNAARLTDEQCKPLEALYDELKSADAKPADLCAKLEEKALSLLSDGQKNTMLAAVLVMPMRAESISDRPSVTLSDKQKEQLQAAYEAANKDLKIGQTLDARAKYFDAFVRSLEAGQKDRILLPYPRPTYMDGGTLYTAHGTPYPDGVVHSPTNGIELRQLMVAGFNDMAIMVTQASPQKIDALTGDALTNAVDPYDAGDQKVKFFKAAGKTNELDAKAFEADRKAGGGLVMPFEKWETAVAFDANKNGKLDWFEFVEYRQAMRKAVLAAYDKDKNGKLTGDERTAALKLLASGKLVIKPDPEAERVGARPPSGAATQAAHASMSAEQLEAAQMAGVHGMYISYIDTAATLSDEQKQKIGELLKADHKESVELQLQSEQRRRELAQVQREAAAGGGDNDKVAAAEKASIEASVAMNEFSRKQRGRMMELLTDEQRVALRASLLVGLANTIIRPATLDAGQVEKLKAAFADQLKDEAFDREGPAMTVYRSGIGTGGGGKFAKQVSDIVQPLLTEKQKEQITWDRAFSEIQQNFRMARMTDEQQNELQAAYDELKKSGGTPGESIAKLHEKAIGLLTNDQKDTMLKLLLTIPYSDEFDSDVKLSDEQRKELKAAEAEADKIRDGAGLTLWEAKWKCFEPFIGTLSAIQKDAILRSLTKPR